MGRNENMPGRYEGWGGKRKSAARGKGRGKEGDLKGKQSRKLLRKDGDGRWWSKSSFSRESKSVLVVCSSDSVECVCRRARSYW